MSVTVSIKNNSASSNHAAWAGAALGELLSHLWAPLMATTVTGGVVVELGCIALGYFIGKQYGTMRSLKEFRAGKKEVKSPTFWNVGLAKGYLLAAVINFVLLFVVAYIGMKLSFVNAIMDGVTLATVIVGGLIEKNHMKDAYEQATQISAKERAKLIMQSFDTAKVIKARSLLESSKLRTQG